MARVRGQRSQPNRRWTSCRTRWTSRGPPWSGAPGRSTGPCTQTYPDAHCELDFTTPLELLVATILSAQTTDKRVNLLTPILFARYPTAAAYAAADRAELEELLKPVGFFRAKSDTLLKLGAALVEDFGGRGARTGSTSSSPARCRPQDRQRRAGQRVRRARHHRRHPLRPAGPAVRVDDVAGARAGGGRDRCDCSPARTGPSSATT